MHIHTRSYMHIHLDPRTHIYIHTLTLSLSLTHTQVWQLTYQMRMFLVYTLNIQPLSRNPVSVTFSHYEHFPDAVTLTEGWGMTSAPPVQCMVTKCGKDCGE